MQLCWSEVEIRPHIVEIDLLVLELFQTYYVIPTKVPKLPGSADDFDKKWDMLEPNNSTNADVCSDSILIEMGDDYEVSNSKQLSPSLNNLHGSLDNLIEKCERSQLSFNDSIKSNCDSDSISCPESFGEDKSMSNRCSTDVSKNVSSDSETEDENWRVKVERGSYTEKVRVKSKSITDLMVLTHIDYCESESDTPFPSLNYKVNCKTSRNPPSKSDLPFMSFGSEGNLLTIKDAVNDKLKVNDEFKKFQEDYSYSQYIPDNNKPKIFQDSNTFKIESNNELNIQPQIFNVYNVTMDNLPCVNNIFSDKNIVSNYETQTNVEVIPALGTFANSPLLQLSEKVCDSNLEDLAIVNNDLKEEKELEINAIENRKDLEFHEVERKYTSSEMEHPLPSIEHNKQSPNIINDSAIEISSLLTHISAKEDLTDKQNSSNTIINQTSIVPYLLYKTVPLKIQFNNFSSITLYDVLVEPYSKNYHINSFKEFNIYFGALWANDGHESENITDSGPKSIIIYNGMDKDKDAEGCPTLTAPVNVWLVKPIPEVPEDKNDGNLDYSLKTWDDFLDKTLHEQRDDFYDFNNEPKSMIFLSDVSSINENKGETQCTYPEMTIEEVLENDCDKEDSLEGDRNSDSDEHSNPEDGHNLTFTKEEPKVLNVNNDGK